MTVTLELKPGAEATARAEAQSRGVAVENYLQTLLEQTLPAPPEDLESLRRRRRVRRPEGGRKGARGAALAQR